MSVTEKASIQYYLLSAIPQMKFEACYAEQRAMIVWRAHPTSRHNRYMLSVVDDRLDLPCGQLIKILGILPPPLYTTDSKTYCGEVAVRLVSDLLLAEPQIGQEEL